MSRTKLSRDPEYLAAREWDLVVVGGGIHGAALVYEAARRGLRVLLLERGDFGGGTTFESLRIVHGGLRYLQSLDLPRFFRSIRERRWFLRSFPDLVQPLACLMPLYGSGMRRPAVMRCALAMNDILSAGRNRGMAAENHLPAGRVLDAEATRIAFPGVPTAGLRGSAVWWDAAMPDSQRVVMEMLRRATGNDAGVLNYLEARDLKTRGPEVAAVVATDLEDGAEHLFRTRVLVNAAGRWCRRVARSFDRDEPALFRASLAWNVLFDRPAPSRHALAVSCPGAGGHTYFLHPWKGRLLAGTGHAPWQGDPDAVQPSRRQVSAFIGELNEAIPDLGLDEDAIVRIFAGLLPAREEGSTRLSVRDVVVDHGAHGGPRGLWSVSGVKLTTARAVAALVLDRAFPGLGPTSAETENTPGASPALWRLDAGEVLGRWPQDLPGLRQLAESESVLHLDDLVQRRTTLWEHPRAASDLGPHLCEVFDWNDLRQAAELERLRKALQWPGQGSPAGSPA